MITAETQRTQRKTWSLFKKALREFFRGRRGKCLSVQGTLKAGDTIVAGKCTIEAMSGGRLLARVGGDLAVLVRAEQAGEYFVRCWSTGGRIPQLVSTAENAKNAEGVGAINKKASANSAPSAVIFPAVRIGPGGDYVRDWPGKTAVSGQPSAVSN